jgi:hypothetical protein
MTTRRKSPKKPESFAAGVNRGQRQVHGEAWRRRRSVAIPGGAGKKITTEVVGKQGTGMSSIGARGPLGWYEVPRALVEPLGLFLRAKGAFTKYAEGVAL